MRRRPPLGIAPLLVLLLSSAVWADVPATPPQPGEQTREAFLKLIDRPRVDPAPEVKEEATEDGIVRFHFTYDSEANQRVPGLLLKQVADAETRRPVTIVLHGTGQKKESELPLLKKLAAKGFIAIAIDGRFHGERGNPAAYNAAIADAFEHPGASHPLYYDTVWDVMRLIDYLHTRPDVDAQRIGLMGISKGGIETWLAAAADRRIAVAIPCISVQSFRWGLEHNAWPKRVGTVQRAFDAAAKSEHVQTPDAEFARRFYDRVLPGIDDQFDGPVMITLIAPRPLLVISGDKDPLNPVPGLRICEGAAEAAYEREHATDRFKVILETNTAHNVTPDAQAAAIQWFARWLMETPAR